MNDSRQRGVAGCRSDPKLKLGRLVDGAGEHGIADGLVDRDAFPSHRRLVDGAVSGRHQAVQGQAGSGTDTHDGFERNLRRRQRYPTAVRLTHIGLFGRQCHQALDRVARAIQRASLDQFGNRVQRHHHRRFRPLPDQEGTGDGDGHQRRDVEATSTQRRKPLFVGVEAGQPDCCEGEDHLGDGGRRAIR